ncbi:hypothetical protein ACJJTC_013365 [Scirpophaga incertulas]
MSSAVASIATRDDGWVIGGDGILEKFFLQVAMICEFLQVIVTGIPDLFFWSFYDVPGEPSSSAFWWSSMVRCDVPDEWEVGSPCSCEHPYTGHCPMLKFRYGKCYGDNTRQILKEIKTTGLFNKPLVYRPGDNYELQNMPKRDYPQRDVYDGIHNRQPAYVTGYTGYVPGMHFRYI